MQSDCNGAETGENGVGVRAAIPASCGTRAGQRENWETARNAKGRPDRGEFTGMNETEAFRALRDNPSYFLKYYPINIAGANVPHAAGAANVLPFKMHRYADQPGSMPSHKVGHYGATRPGRGPLRVLTMEISSFKVEYDSPANPLPWGGQAMGAHSVPWFRSDAIDTAAMDHYLLDHTGDGVMVTGQLSGCTFAWRQVGDTIAAIHVQNAGGDGIAIHNTIHTTGRFAAYPAAPLRTFGRNDYTHYATVIGVRTAGGWKLFAQLSEDRGRTITAAYRIHPGARTPL